MSGYNISPKFCHSSPDEFLDLIENFPTQTPENLITGSVYDKLSKDIWDKYLEKRQTEEMFRNKMNLWKSLNDRIKTSHPNHGLYVTGSTLTGFARNNEDLDMSLIGSDSQNFDRMRAIVCLQNFAPFIKSDNNVKDFELIKPTVPLIIFKHILYDVEVNLSYNNTVNLRNTHLLYHYAKGGAKPAVLPCLQTLFADKFRAFSDIRDLEYSVDFKIPDTAMPYTNKQTLGELLIDFFKYYESFEYDKYVISVRMGKMIPMDKFKQEDAYKSEPYRWKCLCIEEPYSLTNTARAVYKPHIFARIKKVFKYSYETLNCTRDLSSIFVKLD